MRCGAATIELTVPAGSPLAGHGLTGRTARAGEPLAARAIVLEDGRGSRVAWCVVDLLSGTRRLAQQVVARTGAVGIGLDRLVLAGTHTHHGPGGIFGNTLYDRLASSRPGARPAIVASLAEDIAEAIGRASAQMKPAQLGAGEARLWGVARNAALPAFARNLEAPRWGAPGWPGHGAPRSLDEARRAVDPRVRVLAALDDRGAVIASLATFAAHPTSLPAEHTAFDPDWPAVAASIVEARAGGVAAVAAGPTGDTNVMDDALAQGPELRARVGERVGEAICEAVERARQGASSEDVIDPRFIDLALSEQPDIAPWCFGAAAMGGAEDGRSPLHGVVGPSRRGSYFPPDHAQYPKAPALGRAGGLLGRALGLEAPTAWPLHAIRLGHDWIVTVPGEPTVTAAHRIERAVAEETGAKSVLVIGCAGEYAGYFTTEEEYDEQAYEGASTLHGRKSAARLTVVLRALASRDTHERER